MVEAAIRKRLPDKIIEDVIAMQRAYHCLVWGVEAVQFQEFLRTELVKRSAKAGCPVPARAITPHPTSYCASKASSRTWPTASSVCIQARPSWNNSCGTSRPQTTTMAPTPYTCSGCSHHGVRADRGDLGQTPA
ncbi:hypothetical protein CSC42_0003 [Pseudomonas aeruginosa]|nr:hypothetical protein CSC42_0003 [Pseudomonas aeruginosa]